MMGEVIYLQAGLLDAHVIPWERGLFGVSADWRNGWHDRYVVGT